MSFRIASASFHVLIVVMDDRLLEAHSIRPDACLSHRVMTVVGRSAVFQRIGAPGNQFDGFLVIVDVVQISDFALGETLGFLKSQLQQFVFPQISGALL